MVESNIVAPTPEAIDEAGWLLRKGKLVAIPTETVYGVGANANDGRAVGRVFDVKVRPRFNPLIVHYPDPERAWEDVVFNDHAERLADAYWPGPLTLVLPRCANAPVSLLASADLDTLGIRVPDHAVARAIVGAAGVGICAPSANLAGEVSPTTAAHVAESLGDRIAMIVDGGACRIGVESTVVDLSGQHPTMLRPGGVTQAAIESLIGPLAEPETQNTGPKSPGRLQSHYATKLPIRLEISAVRPGEALLAFGPHQIEGAAVELNLSPAGDIVEAAANLFAMLRALDREEYRGIAVMPVPDEGLGQALNDRLRRAASPRDHAGDFLAGARVLR